MSETPILFDELEAETFSFHYVLTNTGRTLFTRRLTDEEATAKNNHLAYLQCHGRYVKTSAAAHSPAPKTRSYTIVR